MDVIVPRMSGDWLVGSGRVDGAVIVGYEPSWRGPARVLQRQGAGDGQNVHEESEMLGKSIYDGLAGQFGQEFTMQFGRWKSGLVRV